MGKKEIQKVKIEKRITCPEAREIGQLYNMPKPNLPSYATALKSSSKKDMATQVCEKELFSQASLKDKLIHKSQNNVKSSTPLEPALADTRTVCTKTFGFVQIKAGNCKCLQCFWETNTFP